MVDPGGSYMLVVDPGGSCVLVVDPGGSGSITWAGGSQPLFQAPASDAGLEDHQGEEMEGGKDPYPPNCSVSPIQECGAVGPVFGLKSGGSIDCGLRLLGLSGTTVYSTVQGPGSRVQGPGSRVQGPGSRVEGPGSRVQGPGSRVQGPGPRVQGPGSRVQGPGSWVQDS